ncbi:hypothetical protein ACFSKL_06275 [Belliella marina]|uniref:Fumarate hydratase n=1 Tax=Belliella marina TaxID=1644146 RepID=A0ABW4VKJ6_9BACT
MPFFPTQSEILVSSLSSKEVISNLGKVTKDVNFLAYDRTQEEGHLFNGTIKENRFSISLVIQKADSFLPLIKGKIEDTPMGSILFLEYSLFPSSAFFLGFWSFVSMGLSIFFGFFANQIWYALICVVFCVLNYAFAWTHFNRKIKNSQKIFHDILEMKKTD